MERPTIAPSIISPLSESEDDACRLTFADLQFFDIKQEFSVALRHLPHWSQAGTLCFITWRLQDSIPVDLLDRWQRERADWLLRRGIHLFKSGWRAQLRELSPTEQAAYHRQFTDRRNDWLDAGHGGGVLRSSQLASIVEKSLKHFDGDRYLLTDFVVMPTHVHILAAFPNEDAMLSQCENWKRFTGRQINQMLGRSGRFWQEDDFDHLIRSESQFHYLRDYIARNGLVAKLQESEYLHFSKPLT
jgi:type I restriction enzyme R subunit